MERVHVHDLLEELLMVLTMEVSPGLACTMRFKCHDFAKTYLITRNRNSIKGVQNFLKKLVGEWVAI